MRVRTESRLRARNDCRAAGRHSVLTRHLPSANMKWRKNVDSPGDGADYSESLLRGEFKEGSLIEVSHEEGAEKLSFVAKPSEAEPDEAEAQV